MVKKPLSEFKCHSSSTKESKANGKTINHTITVIANFYDYLYRNEEVQNDMIEKLMKQVCGTKETS